MSESNAVTIRPREPSDLPALIRILTDVHILTKYPVDGPSTFSAKLENPNALSSIVALCDGNLAGHAQLQSASVLNSAVIESLISHAPITSFATLVSLFVDPRLQGKGIGARLVEEVVAWGNKEGKRLVLVVLEKDVAAIRMYERMGWERGVEYFYESIQGVDYRAFSYLAPV
ncbi:acyl-CoA N-acyltransferase [Cucurbitaria berberidis CBS 394.84]|uniref:Acyl-CoA N-acyltransferase n=1 Tax=Cucurbitaria berberidis CBS 394.84 TaxID=1168544 RepID=A0A9P4GAH8_9PLEO|nr:acyl-CoA N-acyltransferase [Cucurbitaria berberidis CBS 394.84]KAF1841689.1 acyl-CoA N-acyltransferase [Cucurbitaria berberidis CBS 394.84]